MGRRLGRRTERHLPLGQSRKVLSGQGRRLASYILRDCPHLARNRLDGSVVAGNDAGIFALDGAELDASEIRPEYLGLVDGVVRLSAGSPALVKSALVILKRAADVVARLKGIVLKIDLESGGLLISSEVGDRCIVTSSDTRIMLITRDIEENTQTIERGELADLQAGMGVHAYGEFLTSGCLAAGTLVAFTLENADG